VKPACACRRWIASLALLCCVQVSAAPYPTDEQLRTAIEVGAGVLKTEGIELEMLDARKEGLALSLLAAGLSLESGTCLVFYNPRPTEGLTRFFDPLDEKDMPIWLGAIAVHEATHCVEQREAYLRRHFDKVLPPAFKSQGMTVRGYLSVVKSGAVETWGEALADIASVLYLKKTVPDRWIPFARGIAALRHDLAAQWPEHDTSAWLQEVIAREVGKATQQDIFDAAFRLRREVQPK